ncbi:MAG: sigma-70 family RNA polymerase sigma factor [Ferruginibacter sp.]
MESGHNFEKYSEFEVIQRVLAGEIGMFEILIKRTNPFLYKTGRSYNLNHEDTQDLMQDTLIDCFNNLKGFKNLSTFKTWAIKIMLNNCYKKKHKMSFKNEYPLEIRDMSIPMFSSATDTNNAILNKELNTVIENALAQIPEAYRMVFSLRKVIGLSVIETAEALEISEANVKVRLNRAKTMLRSEIEKTYDKGEIY